MPTTTQTCAECGNPTTDVSGLCAACTEAILAEERARDAAYDERQAREDAILGMSETEFERREEFDDGR